MKNCDPIISNSVQTISIWPCVRHRQISWTCMFKQKVLVFELLTVYRFPTCPIATGKVTALDHKVVYDSMELAAFVTETVVARCKVEEVLGGSWDNVSIQPDHYQTKVLWSLT